jgi:hypothetical protein
MQKRERESEWNEEDKEVKNANADESYRVYH